MRRVPTGVLACAVAIALVSTSAAQERFTPQHVAQMRSVTAAAIAPDGRQIAYVVSVPRVPFEEEDGPAWDELHVVGIDGASRPFVTGKVNVSGIRWTPDGSGIAFIARRDPDDTRAIHVIPANGGEARRLIRHETDITQFELSADGRRLAYVARPAPD